MQFASEKQHERRRRRVAAKIIIPLVILKSDIFRLKSIPVRQGRSRAVQFKGADFKTVCSERYVFESTTQSLVSRS